VGFLAGRWSNAMFNLGRVSYFVTVAVCAVLSVIGAVRLLLSLLEQPRSFDSSRGTLYSVAVIAVFLFPCSKAILRMLRGAPLLPRPADRNTRMYLLVLTLAGIARHIFSALLISVYVDIRMNHLSDVSGVGSLVMAAAALYLFTLWVGELVVATSGEHAAADRNPFRASQE
jgi:hypothetical protein